MRVRHDETPQQTQTRWILITECIHDQQNVARLAERRSAHRQSSQTQAHRQSSPALALVGARSYLQVSYETVCVGLHAERVVVIYLCLLSVVFLLASLLLDGRRPLRTNTRFRCLFARVSLRKLSRFLIENLIRIIQSTPLPTVINTE